MSPRPPPKISLKHEWKKELGSEVARQPEGEVARQPEGEVARLTKSSQPTQPTPNPIREVTGRPVANTAVAKDSSRVRSSHESDTFNVEDEVHRKRMEQSIADHDDIHESMMVNEADMDFRIPGLPHSVVKYAQSTSVRQLIQKIENLPDRHALQQDLRQNLSFNPFIPESKQMILSLQRTKVYVFSDSVLCLGKMNENPRSNIAWEERWEWFKTSQEYRDLDRIDGEPTELEWNIFPGFKTLQLSEEVKR